MNKRTVITTILVKGMCLLATLYSNAQSISFYEFETIHLDRVDTVKVYSYGDTVLVLNSIFQEMNFSEEVSFICRNGCVYLNINGQEGLFFGGENVGSWQMGEESERITITWDSLVCDNTDEKIYKFEFAPYYGKDNPYTYDDGTSIFHIQYDATSYYWTPSNGIIAISGDWLSIRKDMKHFLSCIISSEIHCTE